MNLEVVTTFSPSGYELYGRQFIDSFMMHCDNRLICYHESMDLDRIHPQLEWRNLDHDPDRKDFLAEHGSDPDKIGSEADFNSQAIRFCHKVFAVTDAAERSRADWLVWIDSDVRFHGMVDWGAVMPDGKLLAYLGREAVSKDGWTVTKVWRPICTETGFVGYRISDRRVLRMLEDMRRYYTTGEIFTRPKTDWHDAKAFDLCRERSDVPKELWHDISAHVKGTHVWPHTPLQSFCTHNKGPGRKRGAYGRNAP